MDEQPKHNRRVRYSGTHPKSFKEKYKELNPEQYAEEVNKILQQGKTPAGMHRSICVQEILDFFQIVPGQIGLDATLGYGGHTLEILKCLCGKGHLYATDVDSIELPKTIERLKQLGYGEEILSVRKMNFAGIDQIVSEAGPLDFVLADLGVSSMQIDNPDRGFSFKIDGPLDLRLNPNAGKPASHYLKNVDAAELTDVFIANADEPNAGILAHAITQAVKKGQVITTTTHLKNIIEKTLTSLPKRPSKEDIKKTCQRCFQALRIEINDEFAVLDKLLSRLPDVLKPGGKVAILSFHSGEDRRIKKAFQAFYRDGIFSEIALEPVRPSNEEVFNNPRAKSAKLRWAIKA